MFVKYILYSHSFSLKGRRQRPHTFCLKIWKVKMSRRKNNCCSRMLAVIFSAQDLMVNYFLCSDVQVYCTLQREHHPFLNSLSQHLKNWTVVWSCFIAVIFGWYILAALVLLQATFPLIFSLSERGSTPHATPPPPYRVPSLPKPTGLETIAVGVRRSRNTAWRGQSHMHSHSCAP